MATQINMGAQTRKGKDAPDVVGMPEPWWAECKYGDRATIGFVLEDGWTQANRPHTKHGRAWLERWGALAVVDAGREAGTLPTCDVPPSTAPASPPSEQPEGEPSKPRPVQAV